MITVNHSACHFGAVIVEGNGAPISWMSAEGGSQAQLCVCVFAVSRETGVYEMADGTMSGGLRL